jgi:hypothetical protein
MWWEVQAVLQRKVEDDSIWERWCDLWEEEQQKVRQDWVQLP